MLAGEAGRRRRASGRSARHRRGPAGLRRPGAVLAAERRHPRFGARLEGDREAPRGRDDAHQGHRRGAGGEILRLMTLAIRALRLSIVLVALAAVLLPSPPPRRSRTRRERVETFAPRSLAIRDCAISGPGRSAQGVQPAPARSGSRRTLTLQESLQSTARRLARVRFTSSRDSWSRATPGSTPLSAGQAADPERSAPRNRRAADGYPAPHPPDRHARVDDLASPTTAVFFTACCRSSTPPAGPPFRCCWVTGCGSARWRSRGRCST